MKNQWSTTLSDWQGVTNEVKAGSNDLVKSGGVFDTVAAIQTEIDGVVKHDVTFTSTYTDYYVSIEGATIISYTVKNLNSHDAYIGIRFVDDNDNIISSIGDKLIAIGGTYANGASISQVTGATKIKFVKVYGDSFEIIVNTDNSINARVSKNANDIASLTLREESFEQSTVAKFTQTNNELSRVSHLISDIEVQTDKFGYINASGDINSQTSGNNHRTDYTPVDLGYKIHYKGYYQSNDFSAVYGYDDNKEPVEQLLATGNNDRIIEIVNPNIKYIVAWGDVTTHDLEVVILASYDLNNLANQVDENSSDISELNIEVQDLEHKIDNTNVPTNLYGYINSDGSINFQSSGNNHRTDYFAVAKGDKISYTGKYHEGMSAVYGYDANKQPVEKLLATGTHSYVVIEITNPNIKYIMAWGDVSQGTLSVEQLAQANLKKLECVEVVDINGNGDYTSLEDAIYNDISDWNSPSKHRTIIVMPGEYTMNTYYGNTAHFWKVIENRNLSIIGVDRDRCILKNTKGKYIAGRNRVDDACLKLSGNVLIKNLTLLASHEDFDGAEGTPPSAYCVHLDSGGADSVLEVDNCTMVNKQSACIGIGTADNYTIQIRNCSLVTNVDNPSSFSSWSGAIICHNADYTNPATLRIENNVMRSNTPNTLSIVRSGSYTSPIKLEAYRNIIGGNVSIDSGIVTLDNLCYGNNKSELNYQ